MKNFSASRLELSLCCSRWEKFKCRSHCRFYLCEGWIKGKLICYIRITRNYLIKGSVLRPHLVKFWIPLKVIISQVLCVPILAFDLLRCENILANSQLDSPWLWPGSLSLILLLWSSEKSLPSATSWDSVNQAQVSLWHCTGLTQCQSSYWGAQTGHSTSDVVSQVLRRGQIALIDLLPTILVMQPKIFLFLFNWGSIKDIFCSQDHVKLHHIHWKKAIMIMCVYCVSSRLSYFFFFMANPFKVI